MTQQNDSSEKAFSFGARLKAAREALGLSTKEVAIKVFLKENVIVTLEQDQASDHFLPVFLRGYLRTYSQFLGIPQEELALALADIEIKTGALKPIVQAPPAQLTSGHYAMRLFTYLIILTLIGLISGWWYTYGKTNNNASNFQYLYNSITTNTFSKNLRSP